MMSKQRAHKRIRNLKGKGDIFPQPYIVDGMSPLYTQEGTRLEPMMIRLAAVGLGDVPDVPEGFASEADAALMDHYTPQTLDLIERWDVIQHLQEGLHFYVSSQALATYDFLIGQAHMLATSGLLTGYDTMIREMLIDTWLPMVRYAISFLFDYVDNFSLRLPGMDATLDAPALQGGRLKVEETKVFDANEGPVIDPGRDASYQLRRFYRSLLTFEVFARLGLNVEGSVFESTGMGEFYTLPFVNVPKNAMWTISNYNPEGHPSCPKCGCIKRVDYSLPATIWKLVSDQYPRNSLCLECFLGEIEEDARIEGRPLELGHFEHLNIAPLKGKAMGFSHLVDPHGKAKWWPCEKQGED